MKLFKIIILGIIVTLFSCNNDKYNNLEDGIYADIQTSVGDILVKLEYKSVPKTVGSFVSLAEGTSTRVTDSLQGIPFYNGLNFHRVISLANGDSGDFMIQGGCPLANGTGDPGYKFSDEFPTDSIGELLFKHDKAGVLSMANGGPGTNGSQFFITMVAKPHLDGVHSIFGHVVNGQDLVQTEVRTLTKINKIEIIRVGSEAKSFDAPAAINEEFIKADKIKAEFASKMEDFELKAEELPSGLKVYFKKKVDEPKPAVNSDIRIHYVAFFEDGTLLDTNRKEVAEQYGIYNPNRDKQNGYEPFPEKYSMDAKLVHGFKEGIQQMSIGDLAIVFVPSHLAYGEQGNRGVPPNTDLIFELELFDKAE